MRLRQAKHPPPIRNGGLDWGRPPLVMDFRRRGEVLSTVHAGAVGAGEPDSLGMSVLDCHQATLFGHAPALAPKCVAGSAATLALSSCHLANKSAIAGQSAVASALKPDLRRSERLWLRRVIGRVARFDPRFHRLNDCGYKRCTERPGIQVDGDGKAHTVGLVTCGSVHCCPMCEATTRQERADKFAADAGRWQRSGRTTLLVGLTFPHGAGDHLADTYDLVGKGWSWITNQRAWKALRDRLGPMAWCRAVECTHGQEYGWHPHIHCVLMLGTDQEALAAAQVKAVLAPLWDRFLIRNGFPKAHPAHGVDVQICHTASRAAGYICKSQAGWDLSRELARGDLKQAREGHRTFLQIAADYGRTGEASDRGLMQEYMAATFNRKAFSYSKNYAEVTGAVTLPDDDQAEEDQADEVIPSRTVAILDGWVWDRVRDINGLVGQLLDAAEQTGRPAVDRLLVAHGFPESIDPRQESP